eukprot:scaffold48885_cov56-Phaeocystis_antarctica.AAC.1
MQAVVMTVRSTGVVGKVRFLGFSIRKNPKHGNFSVFYPRRSSNHQPKKSTGVQDRIYGARFSDHRRPDFMMRIRRGLYFHPKPAASTGSGQGLEGGSGRIVRALVRGSVRGLVLGVGIGALALIRG